MRTGAISWVVLAPALGALLLGMGSCGRARPSADGSPPPAPEQVAASGAEPAAERPIAPGSAAVRGADATGGAPRRLDAADQVAAVAVSWDAQVDSVRRAQAEGRLERLSVNGRPTPFDRAAYARDPAAYLQVIEPCRIWQMADPGPAVDPLTTPDGQTHLLVRMWPGAQQALSMRTWPGYPVTLTSMDRGAFDNGLTSITAQADASGIATVHFTATAGTTDRVRLLAASPVASGQVSIFIDIADTP